MKLKRFFRTGELFSVTSSTKSTEEIALADDELDEVNSLTIF